MRKLWHFILLALSVLTLASLLLLNSQLHEASSQTSEDAKNSRIFNCQFKTLGDSRGISLLKHLSVKLIHKTNLHMKIYLWPHKHLDIKQKSLTEHVPVWTFGTLDETTPPKPAPYAAGNSRLPVSQTQIP